MTSTPVNLLLKRSTFASDRPSGVVVQNGELALSAGGSDPGLYFEDTGGSIRKIGPSAYGTTAPNSSPVGLAGNSVGETWADSSTAETYFKVWTGSAWSKVGAQHADYATTAASSTFANSAFSAVTSSGALQASGCIVSSGSIFASGAYSVSTVDVGLPDPLTVASGVQFLLFTTSGTYPSGLYVRAGTGYYWV